MLTMRHIVAGHLLLVACPWEWLANLQDRVSQGLFLNHRTHYTRVAVLLFRFSNNAFVI